MKKTFHDKKVQLFLLFISFALILSLIDVVVEKLYFKDSLKNTALHDAISLAHEREEYLSNFLQKSEDMLLSIRDLDLFGDYINHLAHENLIRDIFLMYAKSHPEIMKLRYIDKNGRALMRIDRATPGSAPFVVPHDALQDNSRRYYFTQSRLKPLGKVWFTAIDLNLENDRVEIPYKPTIRAILPLEDKGEFNGILIINFFMQDFLETFVTMPLYDVILCDDRGYSIAHFDRSKAWGFYRKPPYTIADDFPRAAQKILSNDLTETRSLTAKRLDVPIEGGLHLILQLKQSYLQKEERDSTDHSLFIMSIILLASLLLSFIVVKLFSRTLLNLKQLNDLNETLTIASRVANIAFWEYFPKDKKLIWSDGASNIFNMDRHALPATSQEFFACLDPEEVAGVRKALTASIRKRSEFYTLHKLHTQGGELKYVEQRAKHEYDGDTHIRSIGSILDVTEAKRKEREITDYVALIDEHIITSSTDLSGRITYTSKAFCEISGYSREELLGQYHRIIRHPDMPRELYVDLWHTITGGGTWRGEIKNLKKDGGYYWVDATISPIYDEIGHKVGYTAIRQDITDKKLIEEISITDGLTHIHNRRHFNDLFPRIINAARRHDRLVAFLIMDIDYFKQYNDTYGHQMGDEVLIRVAAALRGSLQRAEDFCFRLGGEEFGVIFHPDDRGHATAFAESIRTAVEGLRIEHSKNQSSPYITASMGLICIEPGDEIESDELYKKADELLYRAKAEGRNRVVIG